MNCRAEYLNFFAGLIVATLLACVMFAPQLREAIADRARLQDNVDDIARLCVFRPDGSAECPAGTFILPSTTTTTAAP